MALKKTRAFISKIRPALLQDLLIRIIYGPEYKRRLFAKDYESLLEYFVDPFSALGKCIYDDHIYEKETCMLFNKLIKKGNVCFDIGANEGYFSLLMSKLVGENGRIYAFEPQTRLLPILFKNINQNASFNCTICNFGVGESKSMKEISLFPSNNNAASSIVRPYKLNANKEEIYVFDIDYFVQKSNISKVDFVKIDVEGYEFEVVRGMKKTLSEKKIGTILLDYHTTILKERGISSWEIHSELIKNGYKFSEKEKIFSGFVLYQL
jgi:FkbM family methyltransferase